MAILTLDGLIAGYLAPRNIIKSSATSEGAGTWHSLWKVASVPTAGSNPPAYTAGSGYVPTNATTGAIPFTNPVSGNTYLANVTLAGATTGTLIIYDRLWTCSGFVTNSVSAQNVTTPGSLTRPDANGAYVEIWGEVYTAPGATGATWTVSYTDQDGNAGASATYTHPANAESVGQMLPFTLAAGDTGCRSVQSFTCSISSGTAGDIGITLLRRVATVPIMLTNVAQRLNCFDTGLPRIYDDACLAFMVQCTATNTGFMSGLIQLAQG